MKPHNNNLPQPWRLAGAVLLAACAAFPARAANPPYQTTVQAQNPVGYWRLNETALPLPYTVMATNNGSLGSIANGTYNGDATRGVTGPFSGSTAISLNGIAQSVTTPWQSGLNPNAFSFEAWVNPAQVPFFAYVASSVQTASPRSGWYLAQDNNSTFGLGNAFVVRMFYQNGATPLITLSATNDLPLGSWYHLVLTFDGTTATLYKNGVVASSGPALGYVPNVNAPLSVGMRSDNGFYWPGQAAEVACYAGALTASQVAAHFTAATTNAAGYGAQIRSDNPTLYWRFSEPPDPVAANIGSLGTAANGTYMFPARPGISGPAGASFPGFELNNTAVAFDGTGANVAIKPLNLNTNAVTITCWLKITNAQPPTAGIVFCRSANTVAGLTMDPVYGGHGLGYIWGPEGTGWSPITDSGLPALPDSAWAFAALVVQPSQAALFVCDANYLNFSGATNLPPSGHSAQLFDGPTLIGADTATNALNGAVDEVTIFNRSLSVGEVYSQYATAVGSVPPRVFNDPQTPIDTIYAGDSLQLTVDAGGSPTLTYQWRKNSSPISGATASAYTFASLATSDSATYDCVVANTYGTATSGVAYISVSPMISPVIIQQPLGRTLFPGGTLNLVVQAVGGHLQYLWKKNGNPISGATNSVYNVASVAPADAGSYVVTVSNPAGTIDSTPAATVNVATIVAGTYEATVVADAPVSLWRLDETSLTTMFDALGHNDGFYTNSATLGVPGALSGDPDTAMAGDGTAPWFGVVPYSSTLGNSDFTLECWTKVSATANYCPVSFYDPSSKHGEFYYSDAGAGAWRAAIGAGTDPYLFYYLGDTPFANIVTNQWMHLVITYAASGANSGLRCYVNGQFGGNVYGNFGRNPSAPLLIGGIGGSINYPLKGSVDEVAFYTHALSQAQIQTHYNAAVYPTPTAPVFTFQPASQALVVGQSTTLSALAQGTSPITYQWYMNGTALTGQTANTLALNNVTFAQFGAYQLLASNSVAATPSSTAKISVAPLPTFANATNGLALHLPFDGNYNDSSGNGYNASPVGSPTFVGGRIGTGAFHFNTDTTAGLYNYATFGATTPANLLFSSNLNFSVAYWVRLPAGALPGDLPFLCSETGSTYTTPGLTFAPSYKLGGWAWSLNGVGVYGANNSINDGNWHSLVHTFDRTSSGLTYLDGVLVNTTGITTAGDINTTGAMNIGQDPSGTYGESGAMDIDDLGIWNRVLTSSDAQAIYYAGTHGTSFDTYGPVTVYLTPTPAGFIVTWQAGTLMHASSVAGPWTPVTGASTPNYRVNVGTTNQFFKVKL